MNLLQKSAENYSKYINYNYTFVLECTIDIKVAFRAMNYYHLAGLQYLTDIAQLDKTRKNNSVINIKTICRLTPGCNLWLFCKALQVLLPWKREFLSVLFRNVHKQCDCKADNLPLVAVSYRGQFSNHKFFGNAFLYHLLTMLHTGCGVRNYGNRFFRLRSE